MTPLTRMTYEDQPMQTFLLVSVLIENRINFVNKCDVVNALISLTLLAAAKPLNAALVE
jgi:hypothetical protein